MGALTLRFIDEGGNTVKNLASVITDIETAKIPHDQVNLFDPATVTITDTKAMDLRALAAFQNVRLEESGVGDGMAPGVVYWGRITDPEHDVAELGDGSISLTLHHVTDQANDTTTDYGYVNTNAIADIVDDLATLSGTGFSALLGFWGDRNYPYTTVGGVPAAGVAVPWLGIAVGTPIVPGAEVTQPFDGPATGWTGRFVDGTNTYVPSMAPVQWTSYINATPDGNAITRNTANATNLYDSGGEGFPSHMDAAHDCVMTWQIFQPIQAAVGWASAAGFDVAHLALGIQVNPSGATQIVENGAVVAQGPSWPVDSVSGRLLPNIPFTIAYVGGTFHYYIDGVKVYDSGHAFPGLLTPLALIATAGASVDNATVTRVVRPAQLWWKAQFDEATKLGAFQSLADDTGYYLRLGRDAHGNPVRIFEFGPCDAPSVVRLVDGRGGDGGEMRANPRQRLITGWKRHPADATNLINLAAPIGGTGEGAATLEECWRILYDPTYPTYGQAALFFPEYDDAYPIFRTAKRTGGFSYYVKSVASYAQWGEKRGAMQDAQLTASGPNPAVAEREIMSRGLYQIAKGRFAKYDQPLEVIEVEVDGWGRFPARCGDRVHVDYSDIGEEEGLPFVRDRVNKEFTLMKVEANYETNGRRKDTLTLSSLGRLNDNGKGETHQLAKQLQATQVVFQNSTVPQILPVSICDVDANGSADHSFIYPIKLLRNVARVQEAWIRCEFYPYRQTVTVSDSPTGVHIVTVGDIPIELHALNDLIAAAVPIGGMPIHYHQIALFGGAAGRVPTVDTPYVFVEQTGSNGLRLFVNGSTFGTTETNNQILRPDLTPTTHPHPVAKKDSAVAYIPAGTGLADLPTHVHPLVSGIVDQQPPAVIQLLIDSGDGQWIDRSADLLDSVSNTVGPWSSTFEVEVSRFINAPGRTVRLKFVSIATTANAKGLGRIGVGGLITIEYGAVGFNVQRAA